MRKLLPLVFLLLAVSFKLKAQCPQVTLDASVISCSSNSFSITTANANELIMIAYDGWNGPGSGPVKVDGNPATQIAVANNGNSGTAETYGYIAPAAGVHNIVCTPTGYNYPPYEINMAAAFYTTNCANVFNLANLTSTIATIPCTTGGSITNTISTAFPGAAVYVNCEINEGVNVSYPISWTNATGLGNCHVGNGIEASQGYASAPGACTYSFTATNSSNPNNGCGGLCLIETAIYPPCAGCSNIQLTETHVNPTCNSSNGSISITVNGGAPPYTYVWTPNVSSSANATGLSAGQYIVTVNGVGCGTATDTIVLTTNGFNLRDTVLSRILCNGGLGTLAGIYANGVPPYTFSWSPTGGTADTAVGLPAGTYTLSMTDNSGCTQTVSYNLTQPPVLTVNTVINQASCNGANGSATANAAGGTLQYTYTWSNAETSATATGLVPGTYTVVVTDSNGCTASSTATINSVSTPTVTITVTNVSCFGGSDGSLASNVNGGVSPFTYSWTPVGGTNATATGLSQGTYTLNLTDANGCTSTASATITQPNVLAVTAIGAQTICIGQTATLTANPTGGTLNYTYSWAPSGGTGAIANVTPNVTTTYTVTVNDANGCGPVTATVVVTVRPKITVTVGPNKAACPGDSVSITANAAGGDGTYTFTWTPGGKVGQTVKESPAATTWYTVTVTDNCGTPAGIDSVKVIIDPLPQINFTATPTAGCSPMCVNFTDLTTISSGTLKSWLWNMGNDSTYTSHPAASTCYINPGIYDVTLTVTSDSGCPATRTINNMINVYSHPKANFSFKPQPTSIVNPIIYFVDQSTDQYGSIASWFWNFGDSTDSVSISQYPVHTYQDTGTFCAMLRVTNIHGCTDSTVECVRIDPQYTLYVPTGFSPNGDGRNDVFQVKGNFVLGFKMWIFDRWGQKIFYTEDINNGWNGHYQNVAAMCQQDTYIYVIEAVDGKMNQYNYMGRISLVR